LSLAHCRARGISAAFHVLFAGVLLADVLHLCLYVRVFPDLLAVFWKFLPVFLAWIVALICMIIGFRLKAATVVNYVCCALMLGVLAPLKGFDQAAGDSIAISLSLLAVFLSFNPQLPVRLILAAYLSSVYLDSAIHKLISPMWHSGFGVAAPMGLPSLVWTSTAWMTWFPAWLLRLSGWSVIAFELLFPLLYLWRRTRFLTLLLGIALHVGIAVVYPIPIFSGLMIAAYAGLLGDQSKTQTVLWRPRLVAAIVIAWGLSIANMYVAKSISYTPLQLALRAVRKTTFVTAGISAHGVFADGFFPRYTYQLRFVPDDSTSNRSPEPYSRDGLLGWEVRDCAWENWWKRTQAPWVPLDEAESHLKTWADLYWHPAREQLTVNIEARPQSVELHGIDPLLFSRNLAVRWQKIGIIQLNPSGGAELKWDKPRCPSEKSLGDYISRILAEGSH
jgi:hypothetical protein